MLSLRLVVQCSMRVTILGFCLRVIVKEKPLTLEKTTSICIVILLFLLLQIQCFLELFSSHIEQMQFRANDHRAFGNRVIVAWNVLARPYSMSVGIKCPIF